jgi:hypothetical protein
MILLSSPEQPEKVDAALKEILQRFAIDPDKIAIIGRCGSGGQLLFHNFDVFSRIIAVSSEIHGKGGSGQKLPPPDKDRPVEFLLDAGISETRYNFVAMRDLRAAGYRVKQIMGLRGHEHQWEDYDYVGRWLQESWAKPNPATRAAPQVVADPLPILTTEALTKMTNFWLSFQQEPYEIRMTARREYLREVAVPVGPERSSIILVNMAAFASKYPSVAAKLKAAGLTGQQHDAYRVALISAIVTHNDSSVLGPVDPASVMAKNVAFMEAHPSEFTALDTAGILYPNKVREIVILHPDMVKDKGPLGIWRTP